MADIAVDNTPSSPTTLSSYEDLSKFDTVPIEMLDKSTTGEKKRVPKRVIHFSDGVLEEFSSDEDEVDDSFKQVVDPKMLTWGPWCYYYISTAAQKSLSVADFCGEKLAWFFGITAPKYGYALKEYEQNQKELEEDQARERRLYEESRGLSAVDVQVLGGKEASVSTPGDAKMHGEKY